MVEIWPVYEGREPTRGLPWASLSLDEAIALLELEPRHFISDLSQTPRFGLQDRDSWLSGYKHVIVEVFPDESRPPDWRTGFYRSPVTPAEALNRILRKTLSSILGEANVLRVEHQSSLDSKGRTAARVTVILAPGARSRITGDRGLRAVGRLQSLFANMGIEGTPILQYATEDELAQND